MAEHIAAIARPYVVKLANYIIDAIFRQFKYLFRYNRNIRNLRTEVQNLENKRYYVQLSVDGANRNALVIKSEVDSWLKKVDDLKKEADEVLNSTTNSEMRCLYLRCPNLKTRYLLSKNATEITTAIVELREEGRFDEVGVRAPLKLPSFHGSEALNTRISTKKKIINALEDKDISIVGISGLPGVGKTTMAKEVMTQVLKSGLFDEVTMAVVSKDVDIIRIQDELADMLGLEIDVRTSKIAKAARLRERLAHDNKKRILVILDDLWTDIDLRKLGIHPLSHCKGLKILLTSRDKHVCEKMGAPGPGNIEVEVLDSEEAFALFQEISKISNDDTQLKAIAEQVAKECKGLPLALEVVGKTLRNREPRVWRDALNRLRRSQLSDRVFSSIELSYNYLESDEHRSLLWLCSLFPEDKSIPIESLVRYARGLGLFKDTETLLDTRDRAYAISDNLKSCHFLLSGYNREWWGEEEEVKLHDVIRDFCLSIASKGERRCKVKHDIRTKWPDHDNHESFGAISLTFQGRISLPSRLQYGNLEFLRVQARPYWGKFEIDIPGGFFDYMQELRVIDFTRVQIRSPIQLPPDLRTLCLNLCILEIEMSFFRNLKKLEILTFFGSSLPVDFPHDEMVELNNLRLLDLRFKKGPCPLPPGFLLGMKKLEELYLGRYRYKSYEEKEHIIEELSSLKDLNTLQIETDDDRFLTQLLQGCSEQLEKLERFQICKDCINHSHNFRRELNLGKIDRNMLLEPAIKSLMRRSDKLSLYVNGWNNPVIELVEDGFIDLKSLELLGLDSEYLIDATGSIPSGSFGNLESLELDRMRYLKEIHSGNLPRMEHVTRGVPDPAMFRNLKEIRVRDCDKIKRLFRESVVKCMVNLQKLSITSCPSLEEVVLMDTQENEITEPLSFPKLKEVNLNDLRRFVSFRSQPNAVGLHQTLLNQVELRQLPDLEKLDIFKLHHMKKLLSVEETPLGSPNRLRIVTVHHCDNLVNIAQSNSIKLLQNLETLGVEGCRALNVIFDFEGLNVNKDDEEEISMLGQLKSIDLAQVDDLAHITRMVPKGMCVFQNLKRLHVEYCRRLRYLFPASMINSFVALEFLSVHSCGEIEEIFGREEGEEEEATASKIVFRELGCIELIGLPRFKTFCSRNYKLAFPSLDQLSIQECPGMTKFYWGQLNAPKLKKVWIANNKVIDISNFPRL